MSESGTVGPIGRSTPETPPSGDIVVEGVSEASALSGAAAPVVQAEPLAGRFPVDVDGFRGSLEELVAGAQRGEIDLAGIAVAAITGDFSRRVSLGGIPPAEIADFLGLAGRLVALKAQRLLPDGSLDVEADAADAQAPVDNPGARLAEYRLFRAAADALLADAVEDGMRSFLGIVAAEVVPQERLTIAPERLAVAFRRVLERLPAAEPLQVEAATWSVEDKIGEIASMLRVHSRMGFEDVFARVRSRLEAVACFLALLELVRRGGARVDQEGSFGDIVVIAAANVDAGGGGT